MVLVPGQTAVESFIKPMDGAEGVGASEYMKPVVMLEMLQEKAGSNIELSDYARMLQVIFAKIRNESNKPPEQQDLSNLVIEGVLEPHDISLKMQSERDKS